MNSAGEDGAKNIFPRTKKHDRIQHRQSVYICDAVRVMIDDVKQAPAAVAQSIHARNTNPLAEGSTLLRPEGSVYMGNYAAPPLEQVRVAIIGLSERGIPQAMQFASIPHCRVVGLCDIQGDAAREVADRLEERCGNRPVVYSGCCDAYLTMLREQKPDAVFINTSWETHAAMAVNCMEHGAHAFVEVPLATTLEGLWQIVDASERTRRHCMMLENVNYGRVELMFLNMVRQGLAGELVHAEAAYIHDLRSRMKNDVTSGNTWRSCHFAERNGNLYPTHGLGPVAQYMGLARGEDNFHSLVSMSSLSLGRAAYLQRELPESHPWREREFRCGDVNTSIIRTNEGRTILVQWDETSPRPYNRKNLIAGTRGVLAGFPTRVAGEQLSPPPSQPDPDCAGESGEDCYQWYMGPEAEADLFARYEHPLYARLGDENARNGGMDFIMLYRIIECLHQGLPLDQNVYEGAFWSAVGPLSEKSVAEGGAPQCFPDFTRGDWKTTPPLGIVP